MADCLVDTNILLRRIQRTSPQYPVSRRALRSMYDQGDELYIAAQNIHEFWSVATRPAARGGLALSPIQAARHLLRLRRLFRFLPDTPDVYLEWENLVTSLGIRDTVAFDARLVAIMKVHGLTHILTFNIADFTLF